MLFYQRRQWHPTTVLLPGKSHGRRSLVGCSPWGCSESDTTERLHFHFSPSCLGEGNGNPLQCSCLENPRDGGAWWAAVYGITQSRTRLKRLSSSSSSNSCEGVRGWSFSVGHFSHHTVLLNDSGRLCLGQRIATKFCFRKYLQACSLYTGLFLNKFLKYYWIFKFYFILFNNNINIYYH